MGMFEFFAATQFDSTIEQSKDALGKVADGLFNARSLLSLVITLAVAVLIGRIIAAVLRRFARALGRRADQSQDLRKVNQLRRVETLTILTVALIRMILVVVAAYFWWIYAHPGQQPTAIIGASALVVIIAASTIGPILRDLSNGGVMMAEHWYGVGDHVKIEPFGDLQGVVERVTLRSTQIRGLNGEVIWVSNQSIQGVRVSPKGVRTVAIDLFVTDLKRGLSLVEQINLRLPIGPLLVVRPLKILAQTEVGNDLWHIIAVGDTAPGREWMLQDYAITLMKEMDDKNKRNKILQTDPIARFADADAEKRFTRTIQNARKSTFERRHLPTPESIAKQLTGPLGKNSLRRKPRKKIQ